MQIRVANRQDEPQIRAIVNEARAEQGDSEVDLQGKDSDLLNIESHYFWNDGLFIVAEEEGDIVGIAGALRGEDQQTLELARLAVSAKHRHKGAATKLLGTVFFFARNAEYRRVIYYPDRKNVVEKQPRERFQPDAHHPEIMVIEIPSWRELQGA